MNNPYSTAQIIRERQVDSNEMKSLYFGGPTWMFLTPEQMYGEKAKLRDAHRYYQEASIYFIAKMKKVRFNPAKSVVLNNGSVQGEICICLDWHGI